MQILDMEKDGRSMYSNHCVLNRFVSNLKESGEGKGFERVPEAIVKCQTSTALRKLKKKVTHSRSTWPCVWIDVGQGRTSGGDLLKGYQLLNMIPPHAARTLKLNSAANISRASVIGPVHFTAHSPNISCRSIFRI